jgi:rhodanese-related sulfurtransferase
MPEGGFQRVDVGTARELISGGALIFDVRDADSYSRGHIDGARLATKETLPRLLADTPRDKPVIICCHHGFSSQAYARLIAETGFSAAFSLDGGYEAWAAVDCGGAKPETALSEELRAFLSLHGFAPEDVNAGDKTGATPLMAAARLAPPALVKELLLAGAGVHACNADGNQALWLACVGEIGETIQLLIDAGAELDHVNATSATPLMFAASSGRARAVALLLAAGSDPLFETDLGLSALDMAATAECLALMREAVRHNKAART